MNKAASVKARLFNLAKAGKLAFESVLRRYFQERLLYRISVSEYRDQFILKGGLLFLTFKAPYGRPTKDIDFLGQVENDPEILKKIFQQVSVLHGNDAVRFDPDSISTEIIRERMEQVGVRLKLTAYLSRTRDTIQIDVGFGDVICPGPQEIVFPTLLSESPPLLKAYSKEVAIAEKLHAMIKLSHANSRMKDFYDIWFLATEYDFEAVVLGEAVKKTFEARGTATAKATKGFEEIFSGKFAEDPARNRMWEVFLLRNRIENAPKMFAAVIGIIKDFVTPILGNFQSDTPLSGLWDHAHQAWKRNGITFALVTECD